MPADDPTRGDPARPERAKAAIIRPDARTGPGPPPSARAVRPARAAR